MTIFKKLLTLYHFLKMRQTGVKKSTLSLRLGWGLVVGLLGFRKERGGYGVEMAGAMKMPTDWD